MTPERFKKIRESKGSQFKVAAILGVSQGQISIWEMGYRDIPDDVAEKMNKLEKVN
jgi:DNA-binding transcriptional regulator YiaG